MTPNEIMTEIQKLPPSDIERLSEQLSNYLREKEMPKLTEEELEQREKAFHQKLLNEGFITHLPTQGESDEGDDFEPLVFEGEPLSEQIIRERR